MPQNEGSEREIDPAISSKRLRVVDPQKPVGPYPDEEIHPCLTEFIDRAKTSTAEDFVDYWNTRTPEVKIILYLPGVLFSRDGMDYQVTGCSFVRLFSGNPMVSVKKRGIGMTIEIPLYDVLSGIY